MRSLFGLIPLLAVGVLGAPAPSCSMTWKGQQFTGAVDGDACRFTIRYGEADRWEHSKPVKKM